MNVPQILLIYFIGISFLTFLTFGIDKLKAIKHRFRVPESVLFTLAILGGSIGALIGMHVFHHKTKKLKFKIGIPLILVIQIALVVFLYFSKIQISFI